MLILHVSQPLNPRAAALQGRFGDRGGTIGRADDCTLVLPDPDKHVSRLQAEIRNERGQYVVLNRSAVNPLLVNGRPVVVDQAHPLREGDELHVAQFVMRVQLGGALSAGSSALSPADDPFQDLIPRTMAAGGASVGGWPGSSPASGAQPAPYLPEDVFADLEQFAPMPKPVAPESSRPSSRPSSHASSGSPSPSPFGSPAPAQAQRFEGADPARQRRDARPMDRVFDPAAAPDPLSQLDPLDPFAAPPRSTDGADPLGLAQPSDPLGLGLDTPKPRESIDDLFGLSSAAADPLGAGSPLADPALRDPASARTPGAMPDQVPEINASIKLPRLQPGKPAADPNQVYRSWENPEEISRTRVVPAAGKAATPAPPAAAMAPVAPVAPAARRDETLPSAAMPEQPPALNARSLASMADNAASAHKMDFELPPKTRTTALLDDLNRPAMAAAQSSGGAPDNEFQLLKAFLLGAGISELPRNSGNPAPRQLDAAAMQRLGELLRLLSQGTIELLAARALAKKEMRAEVTVVMARNNNPLKFSPDAGSALGHLLAVRPMRGFMDGPAAVRDAFDDLNAHQIGFVAGMRAAMQGLIARFDPAELEKRLKQRSMLDAMLPMNRKARLWELFTELSGEIAREAEDDFEALFGREFLRAYEAQLDELERKDKS